MKRVIAGFMLGLMLLSCVGCGNQKTTGEDLVTPTIAPTLSGESGAEPTQAEQEETPNPAEDEAEATAIPTPAESETEATAIPTPAEDEAEATAIPTPAESETEATVIPTPAESETAADPTPTTAVVVTPLPTQSAQTAENSIAALFASRGVKAGTCLSDQMVRNVTCTDIITSQFDSITFENLLKPDYVLDRQASAEAGEIVVSFGNSTIQLLDWVQEKGMALRGHTLVWYSQTPSWIFYDNFSTNGTLVDREEMLKRMESYIRQVFALIEELGYTDLFYAYDVVNEALMEDGTMRSDNNYWYRIIGEDYAWYAFYYADLYAPESIELFYNDYNEQYKTDTIIQFVNTLKTEDGRSLIDGIGLQAHLYTGDNLEGYLSVVEKLGSTGLKLQMTELDVGLGGWQNRLSATEENLKTQGQYYYNLIEGLFGLISDGKITMDSITVWGFADSLSWRKEYSPLLYDSKYEPKYSYYGIMQQKDKAGF